MSHEEESPFIERQPTSMMGDRTIALILGLGVGFLALWFRNQWMTWDGLSLLSQLDRNPPPDAIHLLYVPLLRGMRWVAESMMGEASGAPGSAQSLMLLGHTLSAVGAGLAIAFLYLVLRRLSLQAPRLLAIASTLAVATAPPFVKQASAVEVYAPALGLSMVALYCGVRAREDLSWRAQLSTYAWLALAATMHIGVLTLLPVLAVIRSPGGRDWRAIWRRALILCVVVGGLMITASMSPVFSRWSTRSLHYVQAFLPSWSSLLSTEVVSTLDFHLWKAGRFFFENATVFAWLTSASAALWVLVRGARNQRLGMAKRWLLWPLVPLACYLIFGVPLLGLLLHTLVGSSVLILGPGLCLQRWPRLALVWSLIVLLVSGWQCQQIAPEVWERRYQEDPLRVMVEVVDESLPARTVLITGTASRHFEWWSALPKHRIFAIPDALHQGRLQTPPVSGMEVFVREVNRLHDLGLQVLVTHSGLECLHTAGASIASLTRLMTSADPVFQEGSIKIYSVRLSKVEPR